MAVAAILLLIHAIVIGTAAAASVFPPGFSTVTIPSGQVQLTDFQFLPDSAGKLTANRLTLGKSSGNVIYSDAANNARTIAHIPVFSQGDLGLISLALSTSYQTNGQVFLLYTYAGTGGKPVSRLERWIATNPLAPTALRPDRTLLDGITQLDAASANASHGPGTVVLAPDNTLYVGFGDAASFGYADHLAVRALDPDDPHGKILHVDGNGNGVAGNPYIGSASASSWRGRMFASGLRNPFRFSIDPKSSSRLYVGDVGWNSYEEIDVVQAGYVGGWPCWEGTHQTEGYRTFTECVHYYQSHQLDNADGTRKETIPVPSMPLYEFPHFYNGAQHSAAVVGGVFYSGDKYPAAYRGSYLFGDYPPSSPSRIFTMATNGSTIQRPPETNGFASAVGGPVSFKIGPGGDVYFADITTSNIYRIVHG
ncbi:MAG: PQQ-dependent sugar dehydrogenase [Frankiaceae bacterium]